MKLDDTDLTILDALQSDASLTNAELADRAGLSATPCARRVRLMEEAGLFRGTVTLLEPEKLGLPVNVFVQVTLSRQMKENLELFEAAISEWPEVMECYLMTGDFDYLIRVAVTDLAAYQVFIEKLIAIEGLGHVKSSFSLKQIRYKTALPLDHVRTSKS